MTTKKTNKLSAMLMTLLLVISLAIPSTVYGFQDTGDSNEKKLRKGSCWLDGTPNCRKKKGDAPECEVRKHCSAKAYLTPVATIVGIVVALD